MLLPRLDFDVRKFRPLKADLLHAAIRQEQRRYDKFFQRERRIAGLKVTRIAWNIKKQRRIQKMALTERMERYSMQKMDIIKKLENYRLENRISQEDLAEKLQVAFSTVNRWINGKAKPNRIQTYHIEKLISGKRKA